MGTPRPESVAARSAGTRPLLYIALVAIAIVGAFVYDLRFKGIFACSPASYAADRYFAYCNSTAFNDYDHGAFWFGLEPKATEAARAARALFLGSSRTQFGFSSPATHDWFAKRGVSFYLLGFSHSENVTFTGPLLKKLAPAADVYVINTDRFFETEETEPTAEILHGDAAASRYHRKQLWQGPHRVLCSTLGFLCGDSLAFYRSVPDGTWIFQGEPPAPASGMVDVPIRDEAQLPQRISAAKEFVASLPVPSGCVLLTLVPSSFTPTAEAKALSAALGIELYLPNYANLDLRTLDASHLDGPSAQRWSEEFFAMAGGAIDRCLETSRLANGRHVSGAEPTYGLR